MTDRKSFGGEVSEKLADAFIEYCDQRGLTKYRAIEGALRAFMALPPEVQVELMSNNDKNALEILTTAFRDADAEDFLRSLKPADRTKVISLAKQAQKIASQKR